MNISGINPHIRYARQHKTAFKMNIVPSVCCDCRIFFFENMQGDIVIGGNKHTISDKTAVFLPPETKYKLNLTFGTDASFIVLNFDLVTDYEHITSPIETATEMTFDRSNVPLYELPCELSCPIVRNLPHIKRLLMQCVNNFILKNTFYKENSSAALKMCLLEFLKDDSNIANSDLCKKVLSFIHENYIEPNLTNEDIAAHFNYHPYHLSNIVKEETGKTLHQFLIYYRLRGARDLLVTTKYNVAEIAWRTGFGTAAYFTKVFKQNLGMTPREYRKQYSDIIF